jgi:hypothetical protein
MAAVGTPRSAGRFTQSLLDAQAASPARRLNQVTARLFALVVPLLGACSPSSAPAPSSAEEPQSGCPPSLAQARDERLEHTSLPKTFAECVEQVGVDPNDPMRCSYGVSPAKQPVRFDECVRIGGVQVVSDGPGGDHRRCGMDFRCGFRPCIGALCR